MVRKRDSRGRWAKVCQTCKISFKESFIKDFRVKKA